MAISGLPEGSYPDHLKPPQIQRCARGLGIYGEDKGILRGVPAKDYVDDHAEEYHMSENL